MTAAARPTTTEAFIGALVLTGASTRGVCLAGTNGLAVPAAVLAGASAALVAAEYRAAARVR